MKIVVGETQHLKPSQTKRLHALAKRRMRGDALVTPEIARTAAALSRELSRQLGLLIDRTGRIRQIVVGEPSRLYLPDLGRMRGGALRFRGVRLVRTELRGFPLSREDLADLSKLRLDAIVRVAVDPGGNAADVEWAYLLPDPHLRAVRPQLEKARSVSGLPSDALGWVREAETLLAQVFGDDAQDVQRDTAFLVGVWASKSGAKKEALESMRELSELARTAGVLVADEVIQIRKNVDPRTVLGRGKIEELTLQALELGADLLIFDRDLAPSQLRAITNATALKVLDRTQLILDIFARHAQSRDGKIQVELAQLKYALPRLIEKSTAMSRLTGGIGGRGPGETKLEIHRRRAYDRIHRLEREIARLSTQRSVRRSRREAKKTPVVSIVGYTNAGKSTLLNALTNASVVAEDKLFATLDPTTRRLRFPEEREIILTDTVGFIRDLPRDLVNAFKATLEELSKSDLVLHVVDASDGLVEKKRKSVEMILEELDVGSVPRIMVLNKVDQASPLIVSALKKVTAGVAVSALKRSGFEDLLARIQETVFVPASARERFGSSSAACDSGTDPLAV